MWEVQYGVGQVTPIHIMQVQRNLQHQMAITVLHSIESQNSLKTNGSSSTLGNSRVTSFPGTIGVQERRTSVPEHDTTVRAADVEARIAKKVALLDQPVREFTTKPGNSQQQLFDSACNSTLASPVPFTLNSPMTTPRSTPVPATSATLGGTPIPVVRALSRGSEDGLSTIVQNVITASCSSSFSSPDQNLIKKGKNLRILQEFGRILIKIFAKISYCLAKKFYKIFENVLILNGFDVMVDDNYFSII
ncbi:unnamed protein product [Gongylonema pulchrum]|uniref:Transcription initiation factor TFIID subunit 4 n=1 Tax=Gongylonema pulchrum TaxID=637853 RepID=A0A183ETK3_9BILA|nr:unnamed protein product [Gongylonema pulchrum]